jgi:hypothetical protein
LKKTRCSSARTRRRELWLLNWAKPATVRVHRRESDGSTVTDVEPFHPFVWADSDVVDLGIETEKLRGNLKYGWLITVDSWKN